MKNYLLFIFIILTSLKQEVRGQEVFPIPANYGYACDEARYLCGYELDGYMATLDATDSPGLQPEKLCYGISGSLMGDGDPENTQWIAFIADSQDIDIEINFSDCNSGLFGLNGLQAGLHSNCIYDINGFPTGSLVCGELESTMGSISIVPDPLQIEIGSIYYIYIDGFAGSVCDFTIDVISGVCLETPPTEIDCQQDCGVTNELFDNLGCTGFTDTYVFSPSSQIFEDLIGCNTFEPNAELDSIIHIDWEITPDVGFTILSTPTYFDSLDVRATLDVSWDAPGTYTIKPVMSINPLYATCRGMCACTDDIAYTVTIGQSTLDTLPIVILCPNKTYEFCDETFSTDIDVTCEDRETCSITVQEIRVLPRVDLPIDTHYICANECFEFNNIQLCTPDLFNIPSPTACDTFYQFRLIDLELEVSLTTAESLIDCINENALMEADYTVTSSYDDDIQVFWLNELGDTVSHTKSYVATSEGEFTFYAVPLDNAGCFQTISNTVTVDDQTPMISLDPPLLDCNATSGTITLSTTDNIATVLWNGPNGFTSNDQSPTVTEGGTYSVSVTTTNGCNISESTIVPTDLTVPNLIVIHDNFDCSENIPIAQYSSTSNIISVLWSSDSGTSTEDILNLQSPGNYTLTVTADNGCIASESFTVLNDSYDPSLDLNEVYIWRCNDTERIIDLTSSLNPLLNYQWTTLEGSLASNSNILTVNAPGSYILIGTDPSIGCIGRDTISIIDDENIFSDIEFNITNPTCFAGSDGTIEITSYIGGEGPFRFEYNGNKFEDIEAMQFMTGMHTLSIYDSYDCEITKTFEITSSPSFEIITESEISIKYGNKGVLTADVNIDDSQLMSIIWTDSQGNFLAEGKEVEVEADQETIIVTAEDINGCTVSKTVTLNIDYEVEIIHANVFSPNRDGTNDIFMLYNNGSVEIMNNIQIFDRAGELIFEETNMQFNETQNGWNGEFNGQLVQPGVYVFVINYTLGNGVEKNKSGTITVVR